ncbi:MAG: DUF3592 domain-containing protein [Candidatus Delongbacteria bacterium]|jgi:hypothetical protein|nr:DUF3592 domain-containing protein [Candidatus Delongbacteria bacterium]
MGYIPVNTQNISRKTSEPGPKAKFFFGRIFPLIFVAVGFGVFWKGSSDMEMAKKSETWPTVEGKILSSEVVRKTSSSSNGGSSTTYHAEVEYEYTIDGQRYFSDRVSFGQYGSSDRGHAAGIVNIYSPGETATVYYDPEDYNTAVLETGAGFGSWIMLIVGSVFGIIGIVMFWKLPAAMNKKTNQEVIRNQL